MYGADVDDRVSEDWIDGDYLVVYLGSSSLKIQKKQPVWVPPSLARVGS